MAAIHNKASYATKELTKALEEQELVGRKEVAKKKPVYKRQDTVAEGSEKASCAGSTMSPVLPASRSGSPKELAGASKHKVCFDFSCHCQ